jgi:hypothetical protein
VSGIIARKGAVRQSRSLYRSRLKIDRSQLQKPCGAADAAEAVWAEAEDDATGAAF